MPPITSTERWLGNLDTAGLDERDAALFRAIVSANAALDHARAALDAAVLDARAAHHPWVMIGAALGVSRQAAEKRFHRAARAKRRSTL